MGIPPNPDQRLPVQLRPDADNYVISAVTQDRDGPWVRLRGAALLETTEMTFRADEIDYNQDTDSLEARGNVRFRQLITGETLNCDKLEYNLEHKSGKLYNASGSSPSRIVARPGLLTTSNPFTFQGNWAERRQDRYVLHEGFLTDCLLPRPWWRLRANSFDVVPGDHAIAHKATFYVKNVPVFYTPYFYKSLKKEPRRSGFLTPNFATSSRRGVILAAGYYWAINRSYDALYKASLFTARGFAHNLDFRGKINPQTDFNVSVYGVQDRGTASSPAAPGFQIAVEGKSYIGKGWEARGELNYLSSFKFRQTFTETFQEAIFSQTKSVGFVTRHWSDYGFTLVAERNINFQNTDDDAISLRKLPQLEFVTREHAVRDWPVWLSMESTYGLVRRSQPLFQTRQFVERADFAPRVTSAFHWKEFYISPSFGIRQTFWDSSVGSKITGANVTRSARDVLVDFSLPTLSRVFEGPKWFGSKPFGEKVKHIIEPRATYRYVTGINDFSKIIRFDSTELMTNTNEVEFSLTQRLLGKDTAGTVRDVVSWTLLYKRYFDPTFGGAILPGIRNVIQSSADLTGYAYINDPTRQSPVVSVLRAQTKIGLEWRTDYDPRGRGIVNSGVTADGRVNKIMVVVGHYQLKTDPVLAPSANQFRGQITYGGDNQRGWSYGFAAFYDFRQGLLQYSQTQVTYNTDCCGFSVQYRRLGFRNENQFRVAFAISNIGSVGTLKRQERIF